MAVQVGTSASGALLPFLRRSRHDGGGAGRTMSFEMTGEANERLVDITVLSKYSADALSFLFVLITKVYTP
jgi:hypothetical protein